MPSTQQIDAILVYLDQFTAEGFTVGEWHNEPGVMPWFEFSPAVSQFHQAIYDHGWVLTSFDWPAWQETAERYVAEPERIDAADLRTIQQLFTTHVRQDRFCEGHLAAMIECSHIMRLLTRLRELRSQK